MLELLLSQFRSQIVLLLLFAAVLSLFLGETRHATIILTIVLASGPLVFRQEKGAADAVETYPIEKDRALFQPTPRSPRARILCSWVPILSLEERSAP
jgi:magnesium-transporting ATPase (P-type)